MPHAITLGYGTKARYSGGMPIPKTAAPPPRKLLTDDVYRQLLDSIVSGRLEPGVRVSEEKLGKEFGVSRSPVREAVDRLAMIGLVEVESRRGTRIAALDADRYRDTLDALLPLVTESTRIAVDVASELEQRRLLNRIEQLGDDGVALLGPDGLFSAVFAVLGNDRALRLYTDLVPHVRRMWTLQPDALAAGLCDDEPVRLRAAVEQHDGDSAADVVLSWFEREIGDR